MLSEVFYSFVITSGIGFLLGFTRLLYKSKCKKCSCLGCELIRDTDVEEKIDELELQRSKALGNNTLDAEQKV